ENGVGIFGTFAEALEYRVYVVNGMDASGYSSKGLRGGRQKGSEASAEDLAFVARLDWQACDELQVGGSYYIGKAGQDQRVDQPVSMTEFKLPDARTQIWEVHADWRHEGWHARGLFTQATVSDARELSEILSAPMVTSKPVAERMYGGYAELAYEIMPLFAPNSPYGLEAFFRYEYLDTQADIPSGFTRDRSQPRRLLIPGLQFRPHPEVVIKLDYRRIDDWEGDSADEISVGFGLVF
ncbi:MAG: hypothetical protein JRG76_09055, partial [Deltaproteobacteria bacterium]|nr:hypothetical protein [Deltaproteobacteria bacterium]